VSAGAPAAVSCDGAPRDLGLDQGQALRAAVRAALAQLSVAERLGLARGLAARSERDALRYFPHMSERLAGLARGAGVSRRALAALLAREIGPAGAAAGARARSWRAGCRGRREARTGSCAAAPPSTIGARSRSRFPRWFLRSRA